MGCLLAGPIGGKWADAAAARWPAAPAGRLVPGLAGAAAVFPLAALAYAWSFQFQAHVAGPLVSSFFMGGALCLLFPGLMVRLGTRNSKSQRLCLPLEAGLRDVVGLYACNLDLTTRLPKLPTQSMVSIVKQNVAAAAGAAVQALLFISGGLVSGRRLLQCMHAQRALASLPPACRSCTAWLWRANRPNCPPPSLFKSRRWRLLS